MTSPVFGRVMLKAMPGVSTIAAASLCIDALSEVVYFKRKRLEQVQGRRSQCEHPTAPFAAEQDKRMVDGVVDVEQR